VAGVIFKKEAGIEMVHVPYRGSAPLVVDLLAGQVAAFDNIQSSIGYIKAGKLRALAVTSATRLQWLPDIPALADFLPGYEVTGWIGVAAPKNTPIAIIDRLNEEVNAGLADPQIAARRGHGMHGVYCLASRPRQTCHQANRKMEQSR
jgi:tripartite-type tricarboxylate transporter receptor subunit TctC